MDRLVVKKKQKPVIGWREWVALPELKVNRIKVKVDTGARSSALHAERIEILSHYGREKIRFEIYPLQRQKKKRIIAEAYLKGFRAVRSSCGHTEQRPVIHTTVALLGQLWPIEVTLTQRDIMGFRMLLGRQAVKNRFLINPGGSFYGERRHKRLLKEKSRKGVSK